MQSSGIQPLTPARAIVVPRGSPAAGGEVLPLETWVRNLYRNHPAIAIVGPSGSGKSTAIRHLAHVLAELPITFRDDKASLDFVGQECVVAVATTPVKWSVPHIVLQMAPWTESERVDYLLAKHPTRIRSIMKRLETCDCIDELEGSPRLWCAVLDWMARDESCVDLRALLRAMLANILKMFESDEFNTRRILAHTAFTEKEDYIGVPSALQHPYFANMALADCLVGSISAHAAEDDWWRLNFKLPIIRSVADAIRKDETLIAALIERIDTFSEQSLSTSLSVMLKVKSGYRLTRAVHNLNRLRAPAAEWSGIKLPAVKMNDADLRCANLSFAQLKHCNAIGANFSRANLSAALLDHANLQEARLHETTFLRTFLNHALLDHVIAHAADFNHAKMQNASLCDADFTGASFIGTDLSHAKFARTTLLACDLTNACLDDSVMNDLDLRETILNQISAHRALFARTNFEGVCASNIKASSANFFCAAMTGSKFHGADFSGANFRSAGLADIDWENADLLDANFDNAAFHMGTSRSGMVDSPIACEGSRTGFYTDDAGEIYKHPEEIRKANLCGANLIGASVFKSDWYLVDLRGAKYTSDQARWFNKCRAILFDRR